MTEHPTTPPPPPPYNPPPPAGPGAKPVNAPMIVLAYLWILALVPLLMEKEDAEVQWHAKHGIVLLAAEIIIGIIFGIIMNIPGVGCVSCAVYPVYALAVIVVHVLCIMKGLKGERFIIPTLSAFADRF